MKLQNARGTRDFPPEQAIARQKLANSLKYVFELYGYTPLETPLLERYDVLASKYAGGDEILKETFKLKDQGKRELGLRYELTVPMCRFIAMNPNMKLPFKRYQIGEVFRDGPIKLGRYRQFTQCDIDVVGVKGMAADTEIISMVQTAFTELRLDVTIKVNSRKIMKGIIDAAGIKTEKAIDAILAIDKLEKVGIKDVEAELREKGISEKSIKDAMELISIKGSNEDKLSLLKEKVNSKEGIEGLNEMQQLFELLTDRTNVEFSPSLARGLSYYTGTVFETFLNDSEIKSAVAGGGRYDEMIGKFLGSNKEYPAVGISFGLDVILDALKMKGLESSKTPAKVFVIPIKNLGEAMKIAEKLREKGVNTDIDLMGRNVGKNLEYASSMGIPYAIFAGEQELKQGKVKLRNMTNGEEKVVTVEESAKLIANK